MDDLPIVEVNQRLNFDEMSCDEEEDSSETGSGATISTNNSGLLRKKLNFDFVDNCDIDCDEDLAEDEEEEESNHSKRPKLNMSGASGDVGISSLQSTPNGTGFSPCRTRSGRIYINSSSSAEKPTSFAPRSLKNPECEKKTALANPNFHSAKTSISKSASKRFA